MLKDKKTKEIFTTLVATREEAANLAEAANAKAEGDLGITAVKALASEGEAYKSIEGAPTSGDPIEIHRVVPEGRIALEVTRKIDPKAERIAQIELDKRNPSL